MISVAVTAYRESRRGQGEWIRQCVKMAGEAEEVAEVVVVDDYSDDWEFLQATLQDLPKVALSRNPRNLGVFRNKLESIRRCRCDWVQICDSDDLMEPGRFAKLAALPRDENTVYCNSFGRPEFDYRELCGRHTASDYVELRRFNALCRQINTGNHFVPRREFLRRIERQDPWRPQIMPAATTRENAYWQQVHDGADSAFYNTRWLLSGGVMEIVAGLEYEHRRGEGPSAFDAAGRETELLPPLYFYEVCRTLEPSLPEAGRYAERVSQDNRLCVGFSSPGGTIVINRRSLAVQVQ